MCVCVCVCVCVCQLKEYLKIEVMRKERDMDAVGMGRFEKIYAVE